MNVWNFFMYEICSVKDIAISLKCKSKFVNKAY